MLNDIFGGDLSALWAHRQSCGSRKKKRKRDAAHEHTSPGVATNCCSMERHCMSAGRTISNPATDASGIAVNRPISVCASTPKPGGVLE